MERPPCARRHGHQHSPHPHLRDVVDQRCAADPGDLLVVSVSGPVADALAAVEPSADRVPRRRLRFHDDALPEPPLRAALEAPCRASWCWAALWLQWRYPPPAASDPRYGRR